MSFLYCLNTSTIRDKNTSVMNAIDIAADAGYDGIEPWVEEIDKWVKGGGTLSDLQKKATDRGIQIVNLIAFFEWAVGLRLQTHADTDQEYRRCNDQNPTAGGCTINSYACRKTLRSALDQELSDNDVNVEKTSYPMDFIY